MAVTKQTRQYSKKMIFNFLAVALMGWLILLGWAMTLWFRFGFDMAWQRLVQLSNQQRAAIVQFNDASIAEQLNSVWTKLPTECWVGKVSEINDSIRSALPKNRFIESSEFNLIIEKALQITKQFWRLVVITGQVLLIKFMILLAAIPLFALAMTAGLVDGLNQRAIRTSSLGRESSFVFHRLNRLFKRGLIMLLALWLAIPMSITPIFILVPVSVLLCILISMTANRFKKYL